MYSYYVTGNVEIVRIRYNDSGNSIISQYKNTSINYNREIFVILQIKMWSIPRR